MFCCVSPALWLLSGLSSVRVVPWRTHPGSESSGTLAPSLPVGSWWRWSGSGAFSVFRRLPPRLLSRHWTRHPWCPWSRLDRHQTDCRLGETCSRSCCCYCWSPWAEEFWVRPHHLKMNKQEDITPNFIVPTPEHYNSKRNTTQL